MSSKCRWVSDVVAPVMWRRCEISPTTDRPLWLISGPISEMGSSPIGASASGAANNCVMGGGGAVTGGGGVGGGGANGSTSSCGCGWKWQQRHIRLVSSGFVFFFGCFVLFGSIATLYAWLAFTPQYVRTVGGVSSLGCQEDNEGSWSIGVFYGDSPFSLKPIESVSSS